MNTPIIINAEDGEKELNDVFEPGKASRLKRKVTQVAMNFWIKK